MAAPIGTPEPFGTILPVDRAQPKLPSRSSEGGGTPETVEFSDRVRELLDDVNAAQQDAATMAEGFAQGEHNDVHGTMIAIQKADVTLRLVGTLRNRAIEAYREIMRMGA